MSKAGDRLIRAAQEARNASEVHQLRDQVEGLDAELHAAISVAYRHGARDWVRMNYPDHPILNGED